MRRNIRFLGMIVVLLLALYQYWQNPADIQSELQTNVVGKSGWYEVMKVVDGDTLVVDATGDNVVQEEKVRLIGINTPETVDPRRPVECFGKEASEKMKEMVSGRTVKLLSDSTQSDHDKYGRLLRYVFLENGVLVNQQLISEGYAYEYTYDEPYKYQEQFKAAQVEAERLKVGLWGSGCR